MAAGTGLGEFAAASGAKRAAPWFADPVMKEGALRAESQAACLDSRARGGHHQPADFR